MVNGSILTFNFEDDCLNIDLALHTVKRKIFENVTPLTLRQLDWVTQTKNALEFYNPIVGPINQRGKRNGVRYIITTIDYLTRWAKEKPVKDCNAETVAKFIFEYILSRFGCPNVLMSYQGSHFLNKIIEALIEEFRVYHQKILLITLRPMEQ